MVTSYILTLLNLEWILVIGTYSGTVGLRIFCQSGWPAERYLHLLPIVYFGTLTPIIWRWIHEEPTLSDCPACREVCDSPAPNGEFGSLHCCWVDWINCCLPSELEPPALPTVRLQRSSVHILIISGALRFQRIILLIFGPLHRYPAKE